MKDRFEAIGWKGFGCGGRWATCNFLDIAPAAVDAADHSMYQLHWRMTGFSDQSFLSKVSILIATYNSN